VLNATRAFEHLVAGQSKAGDAQTIGWDNNVIKKNPDIENVYNIQIQDPGTEEFITATLVWNNHYQDQYPFKVLPGADSDLRLELWAVDLENPQADYLVDYSDSINDNVEHIHCQTDPNYNNYEIIITFSDSGADSIDADSMERYALAWNVGKSVNEKSILWYDLNGDSRIDELDFAILLNNVNKAIETEEEYLTGDINTDGSINVKDLLILTGQMNSKTK